MGSGCGAVGRAVACNPRGPGFESSHRQLLLNIYLLLTVCRKDENKEKKRPRMAHFFLKKNFHVMVKNVFIYLLCRLENCYLQVDSPESHISRDCWVQDCNVLKKRPCCSLRSVMLNLRLRISGWTPEKFWYSNITYT